MKTNKHEHFKATFLCKSDEDCLNNTFALYVIAIFELVITAVLQNEFNVISVTFLIIASMLLFITAYRLGVNHGGKTR